MAKPGQSPVANPSKGVAAKTVPAAASRARIATGAGGDSGGRGTGVQLSPRSAEVHSPSWAVPAHSVAAVPLTPSSTRNDSIVMGPGGPLASGLQAPLGAAKVSGSAL